MSGNLHHAGSGDGAPRRRFTSILPFAPEHAAQLQVQDIQAGEAERFGQKIGMAADHGPAFSAVEVDADGRVHRVLACAGLAENVPTSDTSGGYASAWAAFANDMRPAQWSAVTAAIRAVLDNCGYARVDMLVSAGFPASRRYAEALGFTLDSLVYARMSK